MYFHTAEVAITQICLLPSFILLGQPLHRSVYFYTAESVIAQICVLSESESASAQICVLSYCWVSHYEYTDLCTFKFHTGVSHYSFTQICVLSYLLVSHHTVCVLSYCWVSHYTDLCTFRPLCQPLHSSTAIRHSDLLLTHTVSVTVTVYQKVGIDS